MRGTSTHTIAAPERSITFLTLPKPPSVNALFRNVAGKGRVKTAGYKAWSDQAGWTLKSQRPAPVCGRVIIVINVERSNNGADVDNMVKATFDLLAGHKVIENDNRVTAFAIAWAPKGDGLLRVAVMPATDLCLQFNLSPGSKTGGWFLQSTDEQGPPD